MTGEEVQAVVDNYNIQYQNTWNQVRFLSYIIASCAGNKINSPKDIITFSWEQSNEVIEEPVDVEVTKQKLLNILNGI